jgi:hypothetical protein
MVPRAAAQTRYFLTGPEIATGASILVSGRYVNGH